MSLELTLMQLRRRPATPERAAELGRLGYIQWLGLLPPDADYQRAAAHAYMAAMPFSATDPAVAEFCGLLHRSLRQPLHPLDLTLPKPQRRGGARERRVPH